MCFVGTPVLVDVADDFTPLRTSDATDVDAGHGAGDRRTPQRLTAEGADGGRSAMTDEDRRRLEEAFLDLLDAEPAEATR